MKLLLIINYITYLILSCKIIYSIWFRNLNYGKQRRTKYLPAVVLAILNIAGRKLIVCAGNIVQDGVNINQCCIHKGVPELLFQVVYLSLPKLSSFFD